MAGVSTPGGTDPVWLEPYDSFHMPTGLPRPLYQGRPVPYTSHVAEDDEEMPFRPRPDLKRVDHGRRAACLEFGLCFLCGEANAPEPVACVWDREAGWPIDDGLLHPRCARLAARHCPHLARHVASGRAMVIVGPKPGLDAWELCYPHDPERLPEGFTALGEIAASGMASIIS